MSEAENLHAENYESIDAVRDRIRDATVFLDEYMKEKNDPFAKVSFTTLNGDEKIEAETTVAMTAAHLQELLAMKDTDDILYKKAKVFMISSIKDSDIQS
ncbi:MAG: hypothetical protein WC761_03480 [Candidatus Paceibacterota bacterium]|jgi:hypothetical protein